MRVRFPPPALYAKSVATGVEPRTHSPAKTGAVSPLDDLARTPRRIGKPPKGELEGSHSAQRGPYRILYNINDATNRVEILRVDHRAEVYRNG